MRTVVELDDEVGTELKRRAGAVDEAEVSSLVNDVLRQHLGLSRRRSTAEQFRQALEAAAGTLTDEEAETLLQEIRESRRNWRER